MESFRERLKWLRKVRGYAQRDLAVAAEVNRGLVAVYESGRSLPGFRVLTQLSSALRCSLDFLMTGHESPFPPIDQTLGKSPETEPPPGGPQGPQAEVVRLLRPDRTEAQPRRAAERSRSTIRSSSRPRRSRGV